MVVSEKLQEEEQEWQILCQINIHRPALSCEIRKTFIFRNKFHAVLCVKCKIH